ncbi:MAG TPA: tyrosine-type recombinase/integrase [Candidatus Dormibacteraeota bacterium]|nr:tyrosine-type recombinase/integrase [Candidatus Dormibacteraeota bacterium]
MYNAQLNAVNQRLKRGEGWIGYRNSTKDGVAVPSKYLYFAFYQGSQQKFVNTKTNDPEQAYRQLLEARGHLSRGERLMPSEVARLRFENLIELLMDYYREKKPASMYTRRTESGTEETFAGLDKLQQFFKQMPVTEITAMKLQEYTKWRRKEGDADATIRRQLGRLRSAFRRAKELDLLTDNHIPTFSLPKDSDARTGFMDIEDFLKFRQEMPERLRLTVTFLYYTGCRGGAAAKITWAMVSKDCTEIEMSGKIMKSGKPHTIPLVGPLAEIAAMLREKRKSFPKPTDRVLDFYAFRGTWNRTCNRLGLGEYDKKLRHYAGLKPHDFRRSAARNLIKAGVDRRTAMKITGHKTEHIFERYNIKTNDDVKDALIKVGEFKIPAVAEIAMAR